MKTLDSFSKRILIIAVSISLFLLSVSVFLLTVQRVNASSPNPAYQPIIGIGADNGRVYYGVHEGSGHYSLKAKSASRANSSFSDG